MDFPGSTNANSASVEISGKVGIGITTESSVIPEESDSTEPSEAPASPKEDTIFGGRLPNAGEHSLYLLMFIGIVVLLLFALASNRKGKEDE